MLMKPVKKSKTNEHTSGPTKKILNKQSGFSLPGQTKLTLLLQKKRDKKLSQTVDVAKEMAQAMMRDKEKFAKNWAKLHSTNKPTHDSPTVSPMKADQQLTSPRSHSKVHPVPSHRKTVKR